MPCTRLPGLSRATFRDAHPAIPVPGRRRGPVPGALVAAVVFALAACFTETEDGPTTELDAVAADEIAYGVSRRVTVEGVQEAVLYADSMYRWRDSTHASVIGLTLYVFDEQGRRRANITSDGGRVSTVGAELTARGNAVLRIPGTGQEIRTDVLNFAIEEDRVWSDVDVVMEEDGCVVEGDSFQADMSFDEIRIWGTRDGECVG